MAKGKTSTGDGQADAAGDSTRERIIAAALRILARDGYGKLSARAIAAEAGTNLALVNYHFGSKQNLLLSLFDALESGKYGRQRALHTDPQRPVSEKWREAVAYYREDLADGFVRTVMELFAVSWSNPAAAERLMQTHNRWRVLLSEAASGLHDLGIDLPPALVANAVGAFWIGLEALYLAGDTEADGHQFAILDAIGDWLETRERAVASEAARSVEQAAENAEQRDTPMG